MVSYVRPRDVGGVISALNDAGGDGRVLAGGTDLLVHVRRHPFDPSVLIDVKAANDLPPAIDVTTDAVRFGAAATMADIADDPRIETWFPALVAAAKVVGSVAIRNRATLAGNLCNGSPAADTAPALLVYGATVSIAGSGGVRQVPVTDFFVGPGATACGAGEIVLSVDLPIPEVGHRSAFQRLTRRRGVDLATVSVAAGITSRGAIAVGLGAVGPTPLLATSAPVADFGDAEEVDRAVGELVSVATPISDIRAGSDYRRAMTAVLTKRAVHAALEGSS